MSNKTKKKDAETITPTEPKGAQPSGQDTIIKPDKHSEAQQRFEHTINKANLDVSDVLLRAYRDYTKQVHDAQYDFEGSALEVYQKYLAKLYQVSEAGIVEEAGNDLYRELVRLTTEISTRSDLRESVEKAYRELITTFALTETQADAAVRRANAYRAYVEILTEACKQVEPAQKQATQAYSEYIKDWEDGIAKGNTALGSAYQDYLKDLNDAYVRSNFEQRNSTAAKNYLAATEKAYKQWQSVYADAAKALAETQESLSRNVQKEQAPQKRA